MEVPTSRLVDEGVLELHILHLMGQSQQGVERSNGAWRCRGWVHVECASEVEVCLGVGGGHGGCRDGAGSCAYGWMDMLLLLYLAIGVSSL